MATVMNIINWLIGHYQVIIASVIALLTALIAVFLMIPGEQPEKAMQGIVDFLTKFSKKP